MQVIFLAFANSQDAPLPLLGKEDDEIYKYLSPRVLKQHFLVHRDSFASTDKIAEYLLLYRDLVSVFMYSGHAGRDALFLDKEEARAEGIAHLLAQCPQLKLVILNGCSTKGQVDQLLQTGVPVVIATNAPVEDAKAMTFSTHFFQALVQQASIGDAFELAIGKVLTTEKITIHRSMVEETVPEEAPLWGIYYDAANKDELNVQLPTYSNIPKPEEFIPNERLTNELWTILAPFSKRIRAQQIMEEEGDVIEKGDKHIAILNSLPRPLAEHLRKLMAPVTSEKQGYDKPSEARLQQMARAYETTMEFITYILLSQLWERKFEDEKFKILPDYLEIIRHFLELNQMEKATYDFSELILALGKLLSGKTFFVEELSQVVEIFQERQSFREAYSFMNILRRKLHQNMIGNYEVEALCIRAEESLVDLYRELGFMAKYTLAAIKHIDVLRYRHMRETSFSHSIVKLMRVFGKLQEEELSMNRFLFNRSVLLLKKEPKADDNAYKELSLSPFIIDENAFDLKTDLFFYIFSSSLYLHSDTYCFKHINRPGDPLLEITDDKYDLIKAQFDVFKQLLWPQMTPEQ